MRAALLAPILPWDMKEAEGTLDLSEFNVNVMTGNNGAHQRSPYDPVIRKWPFFFVQTPELFFTSMELMI